MLFALTTAGIGVEPYQPDGTVDETAFVRTWDEEFDGQQLDPTRWQAPVQVRKGGACTWDPAEVGVQDGLLRLGIRRRTGDGPHYACGAVRTRVDYDPNRTMFQQTYGLFEARCRLPARLDADYWLAFWLMAGDIRDGQLDSRRGSEIDVFESFLAWDGRLNHAFHWGGYGKTHQFTELHGERLSTIKDGGFHVFALLWTREAYVFYLDGRPVSRTDALGLGKPGFPPSQGPCQEPGYLKLTTEAVAWAGPTADWEPHPAETDAAWVDWVRVYAPRP